MTYDQGRKCIKSIDDALNNPLCRMGQDRSTISFLISEIARRDRALETVFKFADSTLFKSVNKALENK